MKTSKYTESQIIGFLKQAESGISVKEICRKEGFSDATFYKWRAKFGGMDATDAKRLSEPGGSALPAFWLAGVQCARRQQRCPPEKPELSGLA